MQAATESLMASALSPDMARMRTMVGTLGENPPQCLLLEGGTESSRKALALWWAARLNCTHLQPVDADPALVRPCLDCSACTRIASQGHSDILAFDGRISNKDDTENPGPVRAFTMDNVRALKSILGDSPRDARLRVVILMGLGGTRDEAANALLKALEEPSPSTVFILLTPQREQLLPTLVSRSWVLTLPWPLPTGTPEALLPWEDALARFLQPAGTPGSGCGWLDRTSAKGAVDQELAGGIILQCQKALTMALRQSLSSSATSAQGTSLPPAQGISPLVRFFSRLSDAHRAAATELLAQSQEALRSTVNPARVLDWLALQLYARQGSPSQGGR